MKLKNIIVYTALFLTIMLSPTLVHAGPGFNDDVDEAPLDGGLSLLVAAGVGYGAKKMRKKTVSKGNL